MPDWFLLTVFLAGYTLYVLGIAFILCCIIGHVVNIAWVLLRKLFPKLPTNREEYYEQTIKQGRRANAELLGIPDRDEH